MDNQIKFALVSIGCAVYGVGNTYKQCLRDAKEWLEPDEKGGWTPKRIENELIVDENIVGGFKVITPEHPDFDYYLEKQGFFVKRDGKWYAEDTAA